MQAVQNDEGQRQSCAGHTGVLDPPHDRSNCRFAREADEVFDKRYRVIGARPLDKRDRYGS